MKRFFVALGALSVTLGCLGQDVPPVDTSDPGPTNVTLQWLVCLSGTNAVPANDSPFRGSGTLSLTGNLLNYLVRLPFPNLSPTAAGIYGPVANATNEDVLFPWSDYSLIPGAPGSTFRGSWEYKGSCTLTSEQVDQLKAGALYVSIQSTRFPKGELRGRICPATPDADSDGDGVPDKDDLCPNSPPGAVVDSRGCSIQEILPCNGPWSSHDDYVQAVRELAATFCKENRISFDDVDAIVQQAADSNCGSPKLPVEVPVITPDTRPAGGLDSAASGQAR